MCGICGFTGEKNPDIMQKMLKSINHRGPDDFGDYSDSNLHFGMTRLSIIDLTLGHQPIANEDKTVWIVFNGEIYNYIELRKELQKRGHHFTTFSDTETIVHGYEEYGLDFLDKLNGMFSIAIWDTRCGKLYLARDRFGIKPLFYAKTSSQLVFGSEIKTLLCHPAIDKSMDYEALSHYLSLRNIPAPYTIYKSIRSLLPGTLLTWSQQDDIKIDRWYNLPMVPGDENANENELVDELDSLIQDSVRLRLRSDVKYGAFLSGGIDSSTITAIMSKYTDNRVKTFCLAFADSPSHKKDSYYARQVAEQYNTDHHEFAISWSDLSNELTRVIKHLDQPFGGVISSFWLSRYIRDHVTVALSGDGADDIFASYGHHRLVWPLDAIKKARENKTSLDLVDFGFFKDRKDWLCELAKSQPWEWRLAYGAFTEPEKQLLLSSKGKELMSSFSTSDFIHKIYNDCPADNDSLNKLLWVDIKTLLPNEILYFNDMLSMAHSIEVRTPFLDYRIVELGCSIPGSLKIRNMTLKYILRKVATRYLPKEIIDRPKEGFVLPKNTWLREGMAPMLHTMLSTERLSRHGLFDPNYIEILKQRFLAGDDSLTFKLWSLIVFDKWLDSNPEIKL